MPLPFYLISAFAFFAPSMPLPLITAGISDGCVCPAGRVLSYYSAKSDVFLAATGGDGTGQQHRSKLLFVVVYLFIYSFVVYLLIYLFILATCVQLFNLKSMTC